MMQDKVYVIEDPSEGPEDTGRARRPEQAERPRGKRSPEKREKSPAVAFSLSVAVWGGGQFYNRQGKLGSLLLLLMLNFYGYIAVAVLYGDAVRDLFGRILVTASPLCFLLWLSYSLGLVIWLAGAWQAYRYAAAERNSPYDGADRRFLPALCSLVLPGWGQFLNGQPKKGAFFLAVTVAALISGASAVGIPLLWPALDPSFARIILDWIFSVSCLALPLVLLVWLIGVFDALQVGIDDIKREPLRDRVGYLRNRIRVHGWKRAVFSHVRRAAISLLILAAFLAGGYFLVPRNFYVSSLDRVRASLSGKGMAVLPEIIAGVLPPAEEAAPIGIETPSDRESIAFPSETARLPAAEPPAEDAGNPPPDERR